jgi:hypothetical protein
VKIPSTPKRAWIDAVFVSIARAEAIRSRLAQNGCGTDKPLSRVESRRPMQLDQDAIASLQLAA